MTWHDLSSPRPSMVPPMQHKDQYDVKIASESGLTSQRPSDAGGIARTTPAGRRTIKSQGIPFHGVWEERLERLDMFTASMMRYCAPEVWTP